MNETIVITYRDAQNGGCCEVEQYGEDGRRFDREEFTWQQTEDPTDDGSQDIVRIADMLFLLYEHIRPPEFSKRMYIKVQRLRFFGKRWWDMIIGTQEKD